MPRLSSADGGPPLPPHATAAVLSARRRCRVAARRRHRAQGCRAAAARRRHRTTSSRKSAQAGDPRPKRACASSPAFARTMRWCQNRNRKNRKRNKDVRAWTRRTRSRARGAAAEGVAELAWRCARRFCFREPTRLRGDVLQLQKESHLFNPLASSASRQAKAARRPRASSAAPSAAGPPAPSTDHLAAAAAYRRRRSAAAAADARMRRTMSPHPRYPHPRRHSGREDAEDHVPAPALPAPPAPLPVARRRQHAASATPSAAAPPAHAPTRRRGGRGVLVSGRRHLPCLRPAGEDGAPAPTRRPQRPRRLAARASRDRHVGADQRQLLGAAPATLRRRPTLWKPRRRHRESRNGSAHLRRLW